MARRPQRYEGPEENYTVEAIFVALIAFCIFLIGVGIGANYFSPRHPSCQIEQV